MRVALVALVLSACVPDPGPPASCDCEVGRARAHVEVLAPRAPVEGRADGFDLDGAVSTGAGPTCVERARDLLSTDDEAPGVDNALATIVWPLETRLHAGLAALHADALAREVIDLVIELDDLQSLRADNDVTVRVLSRGRVVAEAGGTLEGRRLDVRFPELPLELLLDSTVPRTYVLHDAALGARLTEEGLFEGDIGGAIDVTAFDVGSDLARRAADLAPSPDDPLVCERLSVGLFFEAIHEVPLR